MIKEGWELASVTSEIESAGKGNTNGIFITRLFFKKQNLSLCFN
jgi:hypothetical protein